MSSSELARKRVGKVRKSPQAKPAFSEDEIITIGELARICGITDRQISRLTLEGILTRATDDDGKELRGQFRISSVRDYIWYLRDRLPNHALPY